jgi:hypothetical protein
MKNSTELPRIHDIGRPQMQEREAILLMESEDISGLTICQVKGGDGNGWIIKIDINSDPSSQQTLATKREKTQRIFKTSDAALRWCRKIGFDTVNVRL